MLKQAKKPRKSGPETKQQKTTEEPSSVPDVVPAPDTEIESKVGYEFGDEIENILGIQRTKEGFLCAYVTWCHTSPLLLLVLLLLSSSVFC
jgi:hypothetical protein